MRPGSRRRLAVLAASAAAVPAQAQAQSPAAVKATYHLNLPGGDNWGYFRQVLVNLANHLAAVQPRPLDFRVVMHARGLDLLHKAAQADRQIAADIDTMKLAGVRFEICATTMRLNNIALDALYEAAPEDVVPSGVARVAELQHLGFAYIKI